MERFNYEGQASARHFLDISINDENILDILKQQKDDNDTRDTLPPVIFGEEINEDNKGCEAPFVTNRQENDWYEEKGFSPLAPCNDPKKRRLGNSISIPIYYVVLSNNWPNAREKMEEARTWFARYCVNLQIFPVSIKNRIKQNLIRELARKNSHPNNIRRGRFKIYTREIEKTYSYIWTRHLGQPRKFLLIIFVDHFNGVRYTTRGPSRVAGNFAKWPIILIPDDPDVASTNIVSHELIHGLGKKFLGGTPAKTSPYGDRKNCWDEGNCTTEMGNSSRGDNRVPLQKSNDSPMDFASIWEMKKRETIW